MLPTNSTTTSIPALSCDDVCKLLEACSKFNVADLRLGDFHVSMMGAENSFISELPKSITVAEKITQAADAIAQRADEAQTIEDLEDEHLRLLTDDPVAWEEKTLELMRDRGQEKETL